MPIDTQQGVESTRWRKLERERLIAARMAMPAEERLRHTAAITRQLDRLLPGQPGTVVSAYWPIRAEPDLRPWMATAHARGLRVALPVAIALGQALRFREWWPEAPMVRGLWNIPFPAEGPEVAPAAVIAPLVGFDAVCYRLGYGGGFFDRTLQSLASKPLAIGIGYPQQRLATIFPQDHDVPMDWIVPGTEAAFARRPGA
jgi:5-formyltetrahydrofolate cyclo-ligase